MHIGFGRRVHDGLLESHEKETGSGGGSGPHGEWCTIRMTDPSPCADFDELISMLRAGGHRQIAETLHCLLHEAVCKTGSELLGELGLGMVIFQLSDPALSPHVRERIRRCLAAVKEVWPGIERVR